MSQSSPTPAVTNDNWMYQEVNEKVLVTNNIYKSYEYARQRMGYIRKSLNMKRITAKTYAEFYQMDVYLFYGLK